MKIRLSEPDDSYHAEIDSTVMDVEVRECFLGVEFVTEDGARLAVSMRDDGFEVHYWGEGFDAGWVDFKGGVSSQGDRSGALELIASRGCEVFRGASGGCCADTGRSRESEFGATRWCAACIAADALSA